MDIQLLKDCLLFQAESNNDAQQQAIFDGVAQMIPKSCKIHYDKYGNMYITKGKAELYPCVVAHVDQVHKYCNNFNLLQAGDVLLAFDDVRGSQVGVGGDDKCGIYLTVRALREMKACKVVLFKNEEVGCRGSGACDISFFEDVSFIVQGDRKHNYNDCINHTNGVKTTSKDFEHAAKEVLDRHDYAFATGSCTDAGELVVRNVGCCALNLACGYFGAHSSSEIVRISLVDACERFMFDMFETLGHQRWTHIAEKKVYAPYNSTWNNWNKGPGKKNVPLPPLPKHDAGDCPLCASKMEQDKNDHDAYCATCGMYASDIAYWESQIAAL